MDDKVFYNFTYLFIYFSCLGLCCLAVFSLAPAYSTWASHWGGSSCCGPQASVVAAPRLWGTGLIVMVHGLCCSSACRIFPGQESNPYLLYWQADSLPLSQVKPSDKYLQQLIKTENFSPWCEVSATSFSTLPHMRNPKQHLVWVEVFFPFPFFLFLSSPLPLTKK